MSSMPASPPSPLDPPAEELGWLEVVAELAPRFRAWAAELEETATLPVEGLRELHASGLDAAFLPAALGGHAVSMRTFGRVVGAIADTGPSTACIWLMHMGRPSGWSR